MRELALDLHAVRGIKIKMFESQECGEIHITPQKIRKFDPEHGLRLAKRLIEEGLPQRMTMQFTEDKLTRISLTTQPTVDDQRQIRENSGVQNLIDELKSLGYRSKAYSTPKALGR